MTRVFVFYFFYMAGIKLTKILTQLIVHVGKATFFLFVVMPGVMSRRSVAFYSGVDKKKRVTVLNNIISLIICISQNAGDINSNTLVSRDCYTTAVFSVMISICLLDAEEDAASAT